MISPHQVNMKTLSNMGKYFLCYPSPFRHILISNYVNQLTLESFPSLIKLETKAKGFFVMVNNVYLSILPRYLDNIEIVAPNRKSCSGKSLKPFPRAMTGMSGAYVSGKVC